MAFQLNKSKNYVDRPLLTEQDINYLLQLLYNQADPPTNEEDILRWNIAAKLTRSKYRIDKLKYK